MFRRSIILYSSMDMEKKLVAGHLMALAVVLTAGVAVWFYAGCPL